MKRRIEIGIVIALVLSAAAGARGDGCYVPKITVLGQSPKMVASPRQEAILATDGKTVQVILRTHFRAGPKEVAWIVPVPSKPTKIEESSEEVFGILQTQTAPQFEKKNKGGGLHFGCGCAAASREKSLGPPVRIEETGTAGIFEYTVLSATDGEALSKWLNENQYAMPIAAERVFKRYVDKGWYWLAMRVRPEATENPTLAPHPITYTYSDEKLVYPLVISQLSADLRNEILIYVLGASPYVCANWTNTTLTDLTSDKKRKLTAQPDSPSGTNYEDLFLLATEKAGGKLFVTEFVGPGALLPGSTYLTGALQPGLSRSLRGQPTLTRLRALMTPGSMDRDVLLVPMQQSPVSNVIELSASMSSTRRPDVTLAACPIVFFVLILGVVLGRKRGLPRAVRAVGVLCLIVGCVGMTMI